VARWSVGPCFEHLLLANHLMFQPAEDALNGTAPRTRLLVELSVQVGSVTLASKAVAAAGHLQTATAPAIVSSVGTGFAELHYEAPRPPRRDARLEYARRNTILRAEQQNLACRAERFREGAAVWIRIVVISF